jgi:YkoY family integral membrane protein
LPFEVIHAMGMAGRLMNDHPCPYVQPLIVMNLYWPVIGIVVQLIFLEGILSIDNAAVLGVLVSPLPDDQGIPWPVWLRNIGKRVEPLLGPQRIAALRVGLLGAYLGRGTMLFLASLLIDNSWIRLVGAAYLIRLAFEELGDLTPDEETEEERHKALHPSFWGIVLTVEIMDLIFSIDNVIAAVSLSSQLWVVLLGVGIGILTMRFAAGIFSYLVVREPILKQAAYILILNIGVQLIMEGLWGVEISDLIRFTISAGIIFLCLAYAHSSFLRRFHFLFKWIAKGMGYVNSLISWILWPIKTIFAFLVNVMRSSPDSQPVSGED